MQSLQELLPQVVRIACEAGSAIMEYYHQPESMQVSAKEDLSPVTAADMAAQTIIQNGLEALTPELPIISEEAAIADFSERQQWQNYWLVDPLDGTRGFVQRKQEFSVNIAMIDGHESILGVIYVPALDTLYFAAKGLGATQVDQNSEQPITSSSIDWDALRVVIGFYNQLDKLKEILQQYPGFELTKINSSMKFGHLAAGSADIYPREGTTNEWDTAAGQIILTEAGGAVVDLDGNPLQYNNKESLINPSFVALGDPKGMDQVLAIFNQ